MKTKQPFHLGLFMAAIFWSLLMPAYAQVSGAFLEQAGQVAIEAEQGYSRVDLSNINNTLHRWIARSGIADAGGDVFVHAETDSNTVFASGYTPGTPELRYQVQFATPGTYFVWLRMYAADNDSDVAHVGIDGSAPASAAGIASATRNAWSWSRTTLKNRPATITVPSAGLHTINLWAGKDGVRIDRLLLTANSSYVPSGVGPEESPRSDVVPAVRSNGAPAGVQPFGTTNVTLSLATDENATCRHAAVADTGFDAMTGMFSTTGATSHATQVGSLSDGQSYTLYVRCRDSAGNVNQEDYPIAFSIAAPPKHALSVAVSGQGTVNSNPAGINCGSDCSEDYTLGSVVTLTATPAAGYFFGNWSGACSGTSASCSVTLDAAKSVTATFVAALDKVRLNIPSGTINTRTPVYQWYPVAGATQYRLLVKDAAGATKIDAVYASAAVGCPTMAQSCYVTPAVALADGQAIWQVQALATSTSGPWSDALTINVAIQQLLTTAVSGSGSITSNPAGINCGSDCSENYTSGSVITLTATPAAGQVLTGWSGACSGTAACSVTMSAARSVTATFAPLAPTAGLIHHWSFDEGSGTAANDTVGTAAGTVSATWTVGKIGNALDFNGTTGRVNLGSFSDILGVRTISMWIKPNTVTGTQHLFLAGASSNPDHLQMSLGAGRPYGSAKAVYGSGQKRSSQTLAVGSWYNVVLVKSAGVIDKIYVDGVDTTTTAADYSGTGGGPVIGGGFNGAIDDVRIYDRALSATEIQNLFNATGTPGPAPSQYTLSTTVSGSGSITSNPAGINCGSDCSEPYASGAVVTLSATPAAGYNFSGWSGACTGTAACSVTMSAARSVTATFASSTTDTTPPVRSNGSPAGSQAAGTTGVTLSLTTGESATCRYATSAGTGYAAMTGIISSTAATSHATQIGGLSNGQSYTYYVRCRDVAGNVNPDDYAIAFSVASPPPSYALSVTRSGQGTVTSSPAGINCGSDCSESYASATVVTLSAAPASGYTFGGWSGEGCSGASTCTVNMLAARNVTAAFTASGPNPNNDTVSPQPVASGTVPLTLTAPAPAKSTPIRSGIPFPYGAVPSIAHLRLENGAALEMPAQFNALANWPDGSVKSALVQFVGDVSTTPAGYRLVYGNQISRSAVTQAIGVTTGTSGITVDTGVLQLTLSSQTGLVTSVTRDANRNGVYEAGERNVDGSELYLVNAFDNQEYTASRATDAVVTVEENGPVRAVIKATGSMTNTSGARLIKYLVRYYAYRNSDKLDVDYTLVDDRLEENVQANRSTLALSLSSYGLRLNYVSDGAAQYRFGGENGAVYAGSVFNEHYLYQNGEFNYKTVGGMSKSQSYSGVGSGSRAPGWVALDSGNRHMALMVRDFWQQYPNELNINGKVLTVALHPARASGANPETTPIIQGDGEYKRPKTFYFSREGGAKTYQMRLAFGDATPTDAEASQVNDVFQSHKPALAATPAWYTASGVFGDLSVAGSTSAATGYDAWLTRATLERSLNQEENTNLITLYGWRDFGDRLRGGWAAVTNGVRIPSFYNDTHVGSNNFFRMYLRTGDTRWYGMAENNTRHFMDLDVSHGPRRGYHNTGGIPQPAGEIHALGHEMVDHQARNLHRGHAHISGLTDYYLLTGDKRAHDVILEIGNWWKFVTPHFFKMPFRFNDLYREAERDFGWPLYVMNEYVRVTGDAQYHRDVTGHLVNYLIGWWQTPANHIGYNPVTQAMSNDVIGINDASKGTGYWTMTRQDNYGATNMATGANPWMAGSILGNGILFYEQDKRFNAMGQAAGISHATLKDMLFQGMNYVVKHGYVADKKWFAYSEVIRYYSGGSNHLVYPLAYLSRLYNTELAAGRIAHPEWYDMSSSWGSIAREKYDELNATNAGTNSTSSGFYGYEIVYPMDFFKIMGQ